LINLYKSAASCFILEFRRLFLAISYLFVCNWSSTFLINPSWCALSCSIVRSRLFIAESYHFSFDCIWNSLINPYWSASCCLILLFLFSQESFPIFCHYCSSWCSHFLDCQRMLNLQSPLRLWHSFGFLWSKSGWVGFFAFSSFIHFPNSYFC
jgi:hypothetical protein